MSDVLAPLNILLVGDTGTGKTQLAKDIYNYYFGGNKKEGGRGIFIRAHPEVDIYNEIFTELNIDKARRELTDNIDALIYFVDELNRAPTVAQNQFFGLGDGVMDYKGKAIKLGKDGYHLLIATANLGNGEFQGTFDTDKALYNRLRIALDFDYGMFKPTPEDLFSFDSLKADPNVKEAPRRDISDKIIAASKEIAEISKNLSLEEQAVLNYLRFGLNNCQRNGSREKVWPLECQDCQYNSHNDSLCSLIRAPAGERTLNAVKRYASALYYLAKLKDQNVEIDAIDLMFKAFELAGAYQLLLNPMVLRQDYYEQNPKMMAEVVKRLKEDFKANADYICTSLEQAIKGKKITKFFKTEDGQIGNYDALTPEAKKKVKLIQPYTDSREIRPKMG
jgi:predicted Zn-ribbon and HTH transcriptional regulator